MKDLTNKMRKAEESKAEATKNQAARQNAESSELDQKRNKVLFDHISSIQEFCKKYQ